MRLLRRFWNRLPASIGPYWRREEYPWFRCRKCGLWWECGSPWDLWALWQDQYPHLGGE